MKSELEARTPTDAESALWLRDVRQNQENSLSAAFGHSVAKRKLELASAFSGGLLVAGVAHCVAIVLGHPQVVALILIALLLAIALFITFVYQRATTRAFLKQTEFVRRASSSIRIVSDEPDPPKSAIPTS